MRYLRFLLGGLLAVLLAGVLAGSASDGSTEHDPLTAKIGPLSRGSGDIPVLVAPQDEHASALDRVLSGVVGTKNPRMSSHVARLAQTEREARARGETIGALSLSRLDPDLQAMAELRLMRINGRGELQVYVSAVTTVHEAKAAVEAVQGQVERFDDAAGIVQAQVPIGQLETLAHHPSVRFVRLPDYGFPGTGSVTTAGDSILGADATRSAFAVDGTGVSVGVISDGVGGLATSQASGDLPTVDITTCNVVPGSDPTASGAEGTAMLEIVHDLAPGAELWFGNFGFGTSLAFNAAVDCLAANTDVVVDDIGFLNNGPYDGTSPVSTNTSSALNGSGPIRAYATAVGNSADSHYQEPYVDSGFIFDLGPTWNVHGFQATADTSDGGYGLPCAEGSSVYCWNSIFVADGGLIIVFLQWNDPFGGSNNDYDLFLFDEVDGLVAVGGNPQEGTEDPVEAVGWINDSGEDRWFDVLIGNYLGAAASRTFDMFVICYGCALLPNDAIHNFNTAGSSVTNQGDAGGGVISAGAINASDPGNDTIAFYSSRGPTNDIRVKPDITGIDGVSVTGAGGFPSQFFGTSAAAPHIAGIAALLLECNAELLAGEPGDSPSGDRTALRDALLNNAMDLGAAGVDNTYGYGRADASASAAAICDTDGDGVFDTIDNCPAWPNAGQSLPPWPVPADDPDCDGWTTNLENVIGTLPLVACAATLAADDELIDASPPDFDDNRFVNMFDVNAMRPPVFDLLLGKNTNPPNPFYSERFDLNADDFVNMFDVNAIRPPFFNLLVPCTP